MIFYRNSRRMLRQPRAGVKLEMEKIYRFPLAAPRWTDWLPSGAALMNGLFRQVAGQHRCRRWQPCRRCASSGNFAPPETPNQRRG